MEIQKIDGNIDGKWPGYDAFCKIKSFVITKDTRFIKNTLEKHKTSNNSLFVPCRTKIIDETTTQNEIVLCCSVRNTDINQIEEIFKDVVNKIKTREEKIIKKTENRNKWFRKIIKNISAKHDTKKITPSIKKEFKIENGDITDGELSIKISEDIIKVYDHNKMLFRYYTNMIIPDSKNNEFHITFDGDKALKNYETIIYEFIDMLVNHNEKLNEYNHTINDIISICSDIGIEIETLPIDVEGNTFSYPRLQIYLNEISPMMNYIVKTINNTFNEEITIKTDDRILVYTKETDFKIFKQKIYKILDIIKTNYNEYNRLQNEHINWINGLIEKINNQHGQYVSASINKMSYNTITTTSTEIDIKPKTNAFFDVKSSDKRMCKNVKVYSSPFDNTLTLYIPWDMEEQETEKQVMFIVKTLSKKIEEWMYHKSKINDMVELVITENQNP
jgi:hypothetical protein